MTFISSPISSYLEVYGYLINQNWLYEHGVENNIELDLSDVANEEDEPDIRGSTISAAMSLLEDQSGLPVDWATVTYKGGVVLCLTFASKDPYDTRPIPSEESLACIKKILKTNRNPKWYRRDD